MRITDLLVAALAICAAIVFLPERACAQSAPELVRGANMSTVGIAAGLPEGAPLRFASELARVLDDGGKMRLIPIVTRGPFENIKDLLFLQGVDLAIVYGDVLDYYKKNPPLPQFESRINYITHLFPSEVHVFVRPEIQRLEDLAGKPVNFNTKGTAAAYSGPLIMDRLGIKVEPRFDPHPSAMREMAVSDKYAAIVWVSTKPLDPLLKGDWPAGFKFLAVPLNDALGEYYLPAELNAADYPKLIPAGERIETVSVPAVLAAYAWQGNTDRYRRVARFIDYFADRLPVLQKEAGFHPRWKDINLAASVPGWKRFPAMQAKLDEIAVGNGHADAAARERIAAQATRAAAIIPVRGPRRAPQSEDEAVALLARAGFQNIGSLRRDMNGHWLGSAIRGNDRIRFSIDQQGFVYARKLSVR